jgi:hypothetical protein
VKSGFNTPVLVFGGWKVDSDIPFMRDPINFISGHSPPPNYCEFSVCFKNESKIDIAILGKKMHS